MALHKFSLLCFLFGLLLPCTDGFIHLNVNPAEIIPDVTQSLTVNCSFSYDGVSNISSIISLIISKSDATDNQTSKFTELESLNIFSPDDIVGLSQQNVTMTGQINANGESYLSIQWPLPQAEQSGLYLCEVHGIDRTGHPAEISQSVRALVASENTDSQQLIDKVSQLQSEVATQRSQINTLLEMAKNQSQALEMLLSLMTNVQNSILDRVDLYAAFHVSGTRAGRRYLLSKHIWSDASVAGKTCERYGGYLAAIDDLDEHQFVKDFLGQIPVNIEKVLLNGTDEGHDHLWTFTNTNQTLPYSGWAPDEPRYEGPLYNCMTAERGYQWQFGDYTCTGLSHEDQRFLCEVTIN